MKSTPVEKKSLWERKEEQNRADILQAAENLFNERGISQVSVQDIANQVMLSRATLYNYFGNKDGIMYALVSTRMHEGNERLTELLKSPLESYEKLMKFIEVSFDASMSSPSRYAILRQFLKADNTAETKMEERYEKYLDKDTQRFKNLPEIDLETSFLLSFLEEIWTYEKLLSGIISQCQEQDEVRQSHHPMELTYLVIMTLNGLADQVALHKTPLEKFNIRIQTIRELFLTMIDRILRR